MAFWFSFFLWLGTYVLADFFRARLPRPEPAGIGDITVPTATEGRYVPIIAGRMRVGGPNVTWYGDYAAEERKVKTGVIFRRSETIGYRYRLALQMTQFRGQCAGMTGVWIGDDKVWDAEEHNGGAPALVVDIDRPDLFGGENQGGGFVGRLRCHNGALDQPPSSYLAGHQDPLPAYRGYTYVVLTNLTEDGGAVIGESPALRDIRIEFQAYDTVANGGLGDTLGLGNDHHIIGKNINPIVFAYDVYTNTDWGRGLPPSDINIDSFKAAAEKVWEEGLGFSILVDSVTDAKDLIDLVEQHVDGYIGPNPVTGQIEVTLARQDYTLVDEFQANAENVLSVKKFSRGEWPQTFNKVLVKYADRTKGYKDTYAVAHDMANRIIQGRVATKTVSYPGVHDADVANKIAWRLIRALARPLATATIEVDRTAYQMRPGRVLSLTDEDVGVVNLPMRVLTVGLGDPLNGTIEIDAVEDVFGDEQPGFADPPPLDFTAAQPVVPLLAADQAAVEAPYVIMQYDEKPDTIPRLLTFARSSPGGRPNAYEVVRRVRPVFGSGSFGPFESSEVVQAGFMTVGALRDALGGWAAGNGSFTVAVDPLDGGSLDELIDTYSPGVDNAAGIAVISPGTDEEEWIAFTTVVDDAGGVQLQGVWRACCDTGMVPHAAGDRVWFVWTGGLGLPLETYDPGAGVEAKFLPRSPTSSVPEAEATALAEVEFHDPPRYTRPLMPRSLLLNGTEFPTGTVSADAPIPPDETGVSVTARLRSWKVAGILNSVRGLNQIGNPLSDSEITVDNVVLEYWLYNLDDTPTPTRVDAVLNATVAVTSVDQVFSLLRSDLVAAGISTNSFAARLEIEVKHSPNGETADQPSIRPFFFDFTMVGQFSNVDPFFDNVVLLVGFEGADGSTVFVDDSASGHPITTNGDAQLDDTEAKFGTSSLLLDGAGDYLSIADHADFSFGSGDFTIEFFVRFSNDPAGTRMALVTKLQATTDDREWWILLNPNGNLQFNYSTNGTHYNGSATSGAWNPSPGVWYHVAVARDGDTVRSFIDGVELASTVIGGATTFFDGDSDVRLGAMVDVSLGDYLDGRLEEVRITKGVARYTENFTPPAKPFPRSA